MKVTADTITDDQVRSLLTDKEYLDAKDADRPPWRTQLHYIRHALEGHTNSTNSRYRSREICAEIWNSRHER